MENLESLIPASVKVKFEMDSETAMEIATITKNLELTDKIFIDINKEVYNDNELKVKIKPFKEGSFEYEIILSKFFVSSILTLLDINNLKSIVTIFGELFKLYKILKNEPESKITHNGDKIEIINNKGTINFFHPDTLRVYNNTSAKQAISDNFEALKENKNIRSYKVIEDENDLFTIDREEFNEMILEDEEPEIKVVPVEMTLQVFKPVLKPETKSRYKWEFFHNEQKIFVTVADKEFLKKVLEKGEKFGAGDFLIAKVEVTKKYNKEYGVFEDKEYVIVKVLDHQNAPIQETFDFN